MNLAVGFFVTTKGHYGNQYRWRETWESFKSKLFLQNDSFHINPVINIVNSKDHEQVLLDILKYFEKEGIGDENIIVRNAEWKHHDHSFHSGYLKDFLAMYSHPTILKSDFCLHLEDDWMIDYRPSPSANYSSLSDCIEYLKETPEVFQVKFCRCKNEVKRIKSLPDQLAFKRFTKNEDEKIVEHSDLFSFNPHINRPRDIYMISHLCNNNWNNNILLQRNFEMGFTEMVRQFASTKTPFALLKNKYLPITHIGEKEE